MAETEPPELQLPEPGPMPAYHLWVRYPLSKAFAWVIFTLLGPTYTKGRQHVPRKGGLLVLSNHQADVDPILVQLACHRPVHFMAKSELFETPTLRRWMLKYGAFPVNRGEPDRSAIKRAVALLKAGEAVGVFPEGELSETGHILPLKAGIALLVRMSGAKVICVGLRNTRRIMPYGTTIPRPALRFISARWGKAREFDRKAETEEIMAWAQEELLRLSGETLAEVDPLKDEAVPTGTSASDPAL